MSANQAQYPVRRMCRLLGVSPSGYYAWSRRKSSQHAQADTQLLARIQAIYERSRGTYGAPRIHAELQACGELVSRKRVARLMREAGLRGASRRRQITTTQRDARSRPAPDLVDRNFAAHGRDQLWVADITYYLPDGKTMRLDPERAPLVRLGFERFATGLYIRVQVLEVLAAHGLRTLRGGELSQQKWGEMLSNRLYISRIHQPAWGIDAAGNWPSLVDEDVFWRCQSLLRTDGLIVAKERNNPDFPLRGFLTCGHCGKPLTGSWSQGRNRRYAYYHCPPTAHCRRTNMPRHELEAQFLTLLESLRSRPEFLALFRRIVLDVWNTRKQDIEAQRVAAERKIAEFKRRKDQLLEAFVYQKAIDQQTYKDQLDKLNEGLALAEIEQHAQRYDELDVEAVLAFAERSIPERLPDVAGSQPGPAPEIPVAPVPEGLQIKNGAVRTAVSS